MEDAALMEFNAEMEELFGVESEEQAAPSSQEAHKTFLAQQQRLSSGNTTAEYSATRASAPSTSIEERSCRAGSSDGEARKRGVTTEKLEEQAASEVAGTPPAIVIHIHHHHHHHHH